MDCVAQKNNFDEVCKSYLVALFEEAPSALGQSSADSAEVCYALIIGLRSSVYFDKGMQLKDARRIFLETMLPLCRFDSQQASGEIARL